MAGGRKRRGVSLWRVVPVLLLVVLCVGSVSGAVVADQTTLLGMGYLQSVQSGNTWVADLMGDHFSDQQGWHQRFYSQDIQRELSYLQNAELSNISATREQTLSGQWVTIVRFNWRVAGSTGAWNPAALRVKTDSWLFLPYIRAVEAINP